MWQCAMEKGPKNRKKRSSNWNAFFFSKLQLDGILIGFNCLYVNKMISSWRIHDNYNKRLWKAHQICYLSCHSFSWHNLLWHMTCWVQCAITTGLVTPSKAHTKEIYRGKLGLFFHPCDNALERSGVTGGAECPPEIFHREIFGA